MKRVFFKRVAITAIAVIMSVAVNAQQGKLGVSPVVDFSIPLNRTFTSTIESQTIEYKTSMFHYGIGAKVQYNVIDPLRLEGSFVFLLASKNLGSGWSTTGSIFSFGTDISVNAHYLIKLGESVSSNSAYVYPLAGVTFCKTSDRLIASLVNEKLGERKGTGLNLGCGFESHLKERIKTFSELKFSIIGNEMSKVTLSFGVTFLFN